MFKKYFIKQFAASFLPILLTLLIVSSVIVLFQIAKITSYVQLSLAELLKLYLLMSVKLLIFTVPISYFLALGSCFKKLSSFNEVTILFALGLSPRRLAGSFIALGAAFSIMLALITIFFIPTSFNLYDNFIDYKRTLADISLKTSNYGQHFGDWVYYSKEQNGTDLKDISLKNVKTNKLAFAKSGRVFSKDLRVVLELNDVNFYEFSNDAKVIYMKKLELFANMPKLSNESKSVLDYWRDYKASSKELVIYLNLSLLPLVSTLWVLAWGINFERVEKSYLLPSNFIYLGLYFLPLAIFNKHHFYTIVTCFVVFSLLSFMAFIIRLKRY